MSRDADPSGHPSRDPIIIQDVRTFSVASYVRDEAGISVYEVTHTGVRALSVAVTIAKQARAKKRR